ncbi:hypothetical protein CI109_102263 [Kwoniella shandongensis]|uniref:Uncharacterized protein n=1 Tax=Kwoniella shandongensis TaxID=1734106 RepID=A0A5M6C097_9TREE|nr:uncharacterized protein CI109_003583 [Kwoniella shandongensis]KAA5527930.1 hypothetical protein CI109_003583 [Kwoniella shandongensis]
MMKAFRQPAVLLRQSTTPLFRPSLITSISFPSFREYHGDPGPSSISNRREQKQKLQQAAALGEHRSVRVAGRDVLNQLLDTPPLVRTERAQSRSVSSERTRPSNDRYPRSAGPGHGSRRPTSFRRTDSPSGDSPSSTRYRRPTRPFETREDNPYTTSTRLRRWIAKHSGQVSPAETEEAIAIVAESPKHMVNAPVYNILLGFIGRLRRFDRMWKLYNEMKKRGIKPTSRTYSTMLNAYAGVAHSQDSPDGPIRAPEERTLSRVTILFEHAQAHLKACIDQQAAEVEDLGLAITAQRGPASQGGDVKTAEEELAEEIDIAPINAYLKFLGRHGLWEEMQRVFVGMDLEGPLAPDTVTYTTMFASLYHVYQAREKGKVTLAIGPTAKGLWDQCIRQYTRPSSGEESTQGRGRKGRMVVDKARQIDNDLITHVLRCLLRGRPEDQRYATSLVQEIWSLPSPGQTTPNASAATSSTLPKLNIDVKAATSLINLLSSVRKPTLATHYTLLFLSSEDLKSKLDLHFLKAAIHVLSESGDVAAIQSVIESYQPPTGAEGWPSTTWRAALTSARWAGDYTSALQIFRRATHLSEGAELGEKTKPYLWKTPNGKAHDVRGVVWTRPRPVMVDAQMMSILMKTAMQKSNKELKEVLSIFRHLGGEGRFLVFTPQNEDEGKTYLRDMSPGEVQLTEKIRRDLDERVGLAKEVERALERVGGAEWESLRGSAREVVGRWARAVERHAPGGSGRNSKSPPSSMVDNVPEWEDVEQDGEAVSAAPTTSSFSYQSTNGGFERRGDRPPRPARSYTSGDRPQRSFNGPRDESGGHQARPRFNSDRDRPQRSLDLSRNDFDGYQPRQQSDSSRGDERRPDREGARRSAFAGGDSRVQESKNFVYRPRGAFGRRQGGGSGGDGSRKAGFGVRRGE